MKKCLVAAILLPCALAPVLMMGCASADTVANASTPSVQSGETAAEEVVETEGSGVSGSESEAGNMTVPEKIKKTIEEGGDPTAAVRVAPGEEYYIFDLDESVERSHVYYRTRYGIELSGDLYISKNADLQQKYPALVIGPPFGGVKEQGPGIYANQLAQRGFVVLTFDPAYHGYSGGLPRYTASTELYVEDFGAGVDYLGLLDYVDRERIGAIGICGSGGFVIGAAAQDTRIKAVATSAMYDIAGMGENMTKEARGELVAGMSEQRWEDAASGEAALNIQYSAEAPLEELPEDLEGLDVEWNTFYSLKRGWHPNAYANVTNTSMLSLVSFADLAHMQEISPRPILFITGDIAHSRSMSEDFYERAAEPKELYIVEGAMHIDLYDRVDKIPFDKLESFFKENLK